MLHYDVACVRVLEWGVVGTIRNYLTNSKILFCLGVADYHTSSG